MAIEVAMPEVPRFAMYAGCVMDQLSWQMNRSGLLTATAGLIAQAMARAQAQQAQRTVPANRESFQAQQIEAAQERATYRRAMRDVQYGTEAEKAAAIDYLRAHKAAQEEKASKSSS